MKLSFKNIKMRPKLIGLFVITGILPLIILGVWCSMLVRTALVERSYQQLEAVREIKKTQIQQFFDTREGDLTVLIKTVKTSAENAFLKLDTIQGLKKTYIEDYFAALKDTLHIFRSDPLVRQAVTEFSALLEDESNRVLGPMWGLTAEQYDERMTEIMENHGWGDLYLILPKGDIVYSVRRRPDLGRNMAEAQAQESGLGKAFVMAQNMDAHDIAVADLEPYAASAGRYAGFMMAQVHDDRGNGLGYVAFQFPMEKIERIIRSRQGMGDTGESYLVGKWEGRLGYRSNRQVVDVDIGDEISGGTAEEVLGDQTGRKVTVGEAGVLDIEMYTPLDILGLNWGIITTQSLEEVIATKLRTEDGEEEYFRTYVDQYGYANLFLIHSSGDVFYSVTQGDDYKTNMITGKYSDSGLGKLVQYVLQTKQFAITDFEPYAPANNEPSAFIARPMLNEDDQVEFIVALQLSLESINNVMEQREGMGESGETYLVGSDMLMRSDLRDAPERSVRASFANPTQGSVETEAVKKALAGMSETVVIKNYADETVLSAYAPMIVGGTTWVLLAEIEEAEVIQPIRQLIFSIIQVGAGIVVIVAVFAFFVAKGIADPLKKNVEFTRSIAAGTFDVNIDVVRKDEIGVLANSLIDMNKTIRNVLKTLDDQIWAVQEGHLDSRGDASAFEGGWRALIAGINDLIDTLVGHIDNIPIATKITDRNFNIRYISKAGIEMLGAAEQEEVLGKKCYNLFNTSTCGTTKCTCAKAMHQAAGNHYGEAEAMLDGRQYHLSTVGVPIKNAEGEVTAAMEIMMDQTAIHNAMENARNTANVLLDSVQDLTTSSQEISTTSNEQAAAVKEIVSTMEDSDELAKSIATRIQEVTEMTNSTKGVVNNGFSVIEDSLSKMKEIQHANAATLAEIKMLGQKIQSIWDIVNMINIIAAQTKIIAFNAELEASSVGEVGENFQIVASEIRRLADNIVESTQEIKGKIAEVERSSASVIKVSEEGTAKITEGWQLYSNLQRLFEDVLQSAEVSSSAADRIALSSRQQVSAFEQILQTLKQIAEGVENFVVSTKATTGASGKLRELANALHSVIEEYAGRKDEVYNDVEDNAVENVEEEA